MMNTHIILNKLKLGYHYFFNKELYYWSERVVKSSKGNNKTVFVVRRRAEKVGMFSYFISALSGIAYALEQGYIPVISMIDPNSYLNEEEYGKVNAWEFYFKQPCDLTLVQAYDMNTNVILSSGYVMDKIPNDSMDFFNNKNGVREYWKSICKQYISLSTDVIEFVESKRKQYFDRNDRILGVLYRGTDYTNLKLKNHPVQPSIEEMIKKVDEIRISYSCNKIFIATEDKGALNRFKELYGKNVVTFQKNYVEYSNGYLADSMSTNKRQQGLEYVANIVMLSKCNCLIAGRTSGTIGVVLLNDSYEYEYFWDLGVY